MLWTVIELSNYCPLNCNIFIPQIPRFGLHFTNSCENILFLLVVGLLTILCQLRRLHNVKWDNDYVLERIRNECIVVYFRKKYNNLPGLTEKESKKISSRRAANVALQIYREQVNGFTMRIPPFPSCTLYLVENYIRKQKKIESVRPTMRCGEFHRRRLYLI
jgi:hypothetical protein